MIVRYEIQKNWTETIQVHNLKCHACTSSLDGSTVACSIHIATMCIARHVSREIASEVGRVRVALCASSYRSLAVFVYCK